MPETVALSEVRPSQLYLNAEKLAAVIERVGPDGFEYDPLPYYEFDGQRYLTDGHTRAFVAYLTGAGRLTVQYDADLAEEHDIGVYRECIAWCEEAGVDRVPDLAGRVLGPAEYERQWLDRCQAAAERLDDG